MSANSQACVYVVHSMVGRAKIGRSQNAHRRVSQLRYKSEAKLSLAFAGRCSAPMTAAVEMRAHEILAELSLAFAGRCSAPMTAAVEMRAHEILAESRYRGEWFSVTVNQAVDAVMQAAAELNCRLEPIPLIRTRGRKPTGKDPLMAFRVPPAIRSRVEKLAKEKGVTLSKAILAVLDKHLPKNGEGD
jgi:hypothetical protein